MDERYLKVSTPPPEALKKITGGRLNGKSDINPQWKIEAMTEVYGMCGVGWKFNVTNTNVIDLPGGEKLLYMTVALYTKNGDEWSEPIYGYGGDFIVIKERSGLRANDEAYKMCLTDALGNAMKCVGVASDVYRGFMETKYNNYSKNTNNNAKNNQMTRNAENTSKNKGLYELINVLNENDINPDYFAETLFHRKKEELTATQIAATLKDFPRAVAKFKELDAMENEEIPM